MAKEGANFRASRALRCCWRIRERACLAQFAAAAVTASSVDQVAQSLIKVALEREEEPRLGSGDGRRRLQGRDRDRDD